MTDLDTQLREILGDVFDNKIDDTEAIQYIKEAFKSAGYTTPEQAKQVLKLVNDMANTANNAFQLSTIQYVKPNKALTKAQNLMTGAEWLERFEEELTNSYHKKSSVQMFNVINIAKRVAGLEE